MATQLGTATVSFGATPTNRASVTVTGLSGLSVATHKEAFVQADDSTTDNTTNAHYLLGIWGRFTCEYISSTSMKIYVDLLVGEATGDFKIHYVTAD